MRYWNFGITDSQAADFDADFWSGARSILSLADNTTNQEAGVLLYNPTSAEPCGYEAGTNPLHSIVAVNIDIAQIKSKLGQIPVLIRVNFGVVAGETETNQVRVYRMYSTWDVGDSSSRYKDRTATETWYEDTYGPFPGRDRESVPSYIGPVSEQLTDLSRFYMEITSIITRALRDNTAIRMMLWFKGAVTNLYWKPAITTYRPTLEFYYVYPIEFYQDSGGNIDYSAAIQEDEDDHYYIGAVERGQTGVAYKCWCRNYTDSTQQVEVFDDFPEWTTPVQRDGTGTGQLDYVTLSEPSVSQKYTVVFYSATQFEVLAVAYRDNAISNHPQLNADASWRGTVGSDFTTPVGGFTIPSAAWQSSGIATSDEFEIGVRGNTTDTAWPSDSNDQVEITFDDAGVADATGWRPVCGQRQMTTNSVAVDATSKFFPLRHIVPARWPVSNKCFIHSHDSIDEGTITSTQERLLGADTFTGSGTDDMAAPTGNYNGNANRNYRIQIDATPGGADTFSWSRDGTTSWIATGVACTTAATELEDGILLSWTSATGHTIGDYWTFDADTWGVTVGGLTAGSNTYAAGAIVATTLPIRDFSAGVWSTVSADSGASQSPASRIYLNDTSGYVAGETVYVQQTSDSDVNESAVIAAGGVTSTYIDLTTILLNDYTEGDFCTQKDTGEKPFWIRPVANNSTVEQLKRLRLVARML